MHSYVQALASEFELDWVALSYTRSGADVAEARAFLDSLGAPGRAMELLAKVEDRLALHNFAQILDQVRPQSRCPMTPRVVIARNANTTSSINQACAA